MIKKLSSARADFGEVGLLGAAAWVKLGEQDLL
jgi:hypothetical protein